MQIKTTMRYQYTISVAKRNTATTSSADKDMRSWTTYTLLMRTNGQPLWKQFGGFLQNLTCKHHITQILPSWALVPVKQNLHPCKHCTQTFIVVLFVVSPGHNSVLPLERNKKLYYQVSLPNLPKMKILKISRS